MGWGDEYDSDDEQQQLRTIDEGKENLKSSGAELQIPATHKSRVDAKGIQVITSYKQSPTNPNQLIKTVTKVKVTYFPVKEHKDVAKRRKWKKFGQAALDEDTSNVTIPSKEDVYMEDPHADTDLQDEDPAAAVTSNLNAFWAKQRKRQLERKYDVDVDGGGGAGDNAAQVSFANDKPKGLANAFGGSDNKEGGWKQVGPAAGNKYVPPAARQGLMGKDTGGPGGGRDRRSDDLNTIRVTNISENTTEADLQDLFQRFGRISRVYLAKDKETMISRGFAFVSFVHREDAARAMEKLQGYGYDHLILKLEWARPSAPKDPSTSGTEFRSGYGKALAQDTKEKVSYASNLTRGTR